MVALVPCRGMARGSLTGGVAATRGVFCEPWCVAKVQVLGMVLYICVKVWDGMW